MLTNVSPQNDKVYDTYDYSYSDFPPNSWKRVEQNEEKMMGVPKSWQDTAHSNGLIEDNLVKGLYIHMCQES